MQQENSNPRPGGSIRRRLADRVPSRRQVLRASALAAMAGFLTSVSPQHYPPVHSGDLTPYMPRLRNQFDRLHERVRGWIMAGPETIARPGPTRETSYVYTVDTAQLMEHFARAGDLEPYLKLRQFAVDHVIVDDDSEPFTKGFVLWRCVPNTPPDASGTTEALRVARALWAGAETFGRPEDRELALVILDGYARHANVDQDIWIIRNYFNFGNRAFATNTFVIDYDADFVRQVADDLRTRAPDRHPKMAELADNSYGLMRRVVAPSGLLYDLVQPEVKTMYWGMDVSAFSPNDVIQTNNACTTAATIVHGEPAIANRVLSFVTGKLMTDGKVYAHYYGRTGDRVSWMGIGAAETMAIARLAALLQNRPAVGQFLQTGVPFWENFCNTAGPNRAWESSELLLGLRDILALG